MLLPARRILVCVKAAKWEKHDGTSGETLSPLKILFGFLKPMCVHLRPRKARRYFR